MPETASTWMTYRELADALGLRSPDTAAARARRARWPKRIRNDTGEAEIEVPADALAKARKRPADKPPPDVPPDIPPNVAPDVGAAVQAAVGPLQALLERESQDRRTLQAQADDLREKLATAQLDAAKATGHANTEQARREAAEKLAADLQRQLEELRQQAARRRWWWPF